MTALKGENMSTATLANGCFWCTEAIFKRLKGVWRVTPGYTGGKTQHPNYDQVSMGNTGHAEAIQIEFDTSIISYDVLLDVFFTTHDPTTLNAQGNDIGTQYRSAIFFHTKEQELAARSKKDELDKSMKFPAKIVTEITPFTVFYPAENYHKDYYERNKESNPYCRVIIDPKIKKLFKEYSSLLLEKYSDPKN